MLNGTLDFGNHIMLCLICFGAPRKNIGYVLPSLRCLQSFISIPANIAPRIMDSGLGLIFSHSAIMLFATVTHVSMLRGYLSGLLLDVNGMFRLRAIIPSSIYIRFSASRLSTYDVILLLVFSLYLWVL